ncbi:MAG: caspase family protein [Phyllobacteriaceae bacterium]|nr:caspase family protein [Phyllobacteriaceae bacterium]
MIALIRIVVVLMALAGAWPALAAKRVALVFSAQKYEFIRPLKNPGRDAALVAEALEKLGFAVTIENDRDLRRMRRALDDFRADRTGAEVALVYFAGHGVEISGENRLLPVNADSSSLAALKASTIALDEIRAAAATIAPSVLIVLDACRDDPFGAGAAEGRSAKALGADVQATANPGFGRVGRAENALFAFAAAPGATASDGDGANSPFSAAFASLLATDGLEIRSVLTLVQQQVYEASDGRQLPYVESGLPKLFFAAETGDLPERERLLLAMADVTPDMRAEVERVAGDAGMPLGPLYGALIAADLQSLTADERRARLEDAAAAFVKTRDDLRKLAADDPRVADLRGRAAQALALGAFDEARGLLRSAFTVDDASRQALKANFVDRTLSAANTRAVSAGAAPRRARLFRRRRRIRVGGGIVSRDRIGGARRKRSLALDLAAGGTRRSLYPDRPVGGGAANLRSDAPGRRHPSGCLAGRPAVPPRRRRRFGAARRRLPRRRPHQGCLGALP